MQSTVHLFNMALTHLGGEQLNVLISPQEQGTIGQTCRNNFPHLLDTALAAGAWSFATRRKTLAAPVLAQDAANPEYPHAFTLPSDYVKALRLEGYAGVNKTPPYVIEGDTIRCVSPSAVLVYVARVTDPRLWPPLFADALAFAVAAMLASAVNNDTQKKLALMQQYGAALSVAIAADKQNQNPRRKRSEWTAARFGEGEY